MTMGEMKLKRPEAEKPTSANCRREGLRRGDLGGGIWRRVLSRSSVRERINLDSLWRVSVGEIKVDDEGRRGWADGEVRVTG